MHEKGLLMINVSGDLQQAYSCDKQFVSSKNEWKAPNGNWVEQTIYSA